MDKNNNHNNNIRFGFTSQIDIEVLLYLSCELSHHNIPHLMLPVLYIYSIFRNIILVFLKNYLVHRKVKLK